MGQELRRLDSSDRVFHQAAEFLALLVGDGGSQVLNLDQPLADENHLSDFGDTRHPGVADKPRIQSEQPLGLFWVSARTCLPLEQAALSVEAADRVDVGNKVVLLSNRSGELDLQITSGLVNLDTVILTEPGQQHDSLPQHPIPGVSVGVMQRQRRKRSPIGKCGAPARVRQLACFPRSVFDGIPFRGPRRIPLESYETVLKYIRNHIT